MSALACVSVGATLVFPGEAFDAEAVLSAVQDERCTALHGVPTMFIAELEHPNFARYDLRSLRTGIIAGSPCPIEVMKRLVTQMHMEGITIAYGMTETSPVSFQSAISDPIEKRTTTVGRVHPHLEVKIIDDAGKIVPRGVAGELCIRGYSVMRGYWDDDEATRASIIDGWMHSGDLAVLDSEGYCNIVGRKQDMVIRGGENIYPREVEEILFQHPMVQSAQVFGVPDERYGEQLCAWVIARPGASVSLEEIVSFCQANLAPYKVPKHVRLVLEIPMTASGKPQKFLMRAHMIAELNLSETKTA